MANPIKYPNNFFLGAGIVNPRIYFTKLKEIIDNVNSLMDGTITTTSLVLSGSLTSTLSTDSTTSLTGAIITAGGIGVAKAVNIGTTLNVGTNQSFSKEVNHTVIVTTTTTAATAGGNLSIASGAGATSGAGGTLNTTGGAGGVTGAGGVLNLISGAGGTTSGAGGALNITSGAATIGSSGAITVSSGNTASGVAGDVILTTGTFTSTTVSPIISLNKAVVHKPANTAVATGGTVTGPQLVGGLLTVTGATGNVQLPTSAQLTTAIGSTPEGTYFDFVVNATGMTGTNTVTLVVGSNMAVMSAPAITGGSTLTVTQDTQIIGHFRITFAGTGCLISRIA